MEVCLIGLYKKYLEKNQALCLLLISKCVVMKYVSYLHIVLSLTMTVRDTSYT